MHLPPLCRVLGIHCLSKMFSLLVVQAIKGFSWKIRKPLFIISAVRKEQCYWEALLLHFLVKARPLKWCSCWYGGGATYGLLCDSVLVAFVLWPGDVCGTAEAQGPCWARSTPLAWACAGELLCGSQIPRCVMGFSQDHYRCKSTVNEMVFRYYLRKIGV